MGSSSGVRSLEHTPVDASLFMPPELRHGLFRTLWCDAKHTSWCWRSTRSRPRSRSRRPTAWRCKCEERQSPSQPTSPKDFVGVGKLTKRAMNMAEASLEESRYYLILA